jgi:hypothetical protein
VVDDGVPAVRKAEYIEVDFAADDERAAGFGLEDDRLMRGTAGGVERGDVFLREVVGEGRFRRAAAGSRS